MPSLKQSYEQVCPEVYRKTQLDILELKSKLPADTVGEIIDEVLARVKAIGTTNTYLLDHPPQRVVDKLCYALISTENDEAAQFIEGKRQDGASLEAIYLAYLREAARTLGDWWTDDHVSFVEVSIGTSRIYSIMRSLGYLFVPDKPVAVKSAVFATVPGETHILGVRMAADLLGKEGWEIDLHVSLSHDDLLEAISQSHCRVIGLSAAGVHASAALARLVIALRISNPGARIFLSGQITREAPDLVPLMGLDGVASDVETALALMNRFWAETSTAKL
ncbi:cobalamin-dependent protein [uncultured Roseobacter sp.]|uniref:cobalamin B12-binding domain-containing protein n=1 Tax=uncultured Roseobacter sp. TaxID=114847 RepID=UPI00262C6057|nr:cobalamin-dependent protein [uncultured Roseobacter sp.]